MGRGSIKFRSNIKRTKNDQYFIEICSKFSTKIGRQSWERKLILCSLGVVEKVLRRRKNQVNVKWLGFNDSHNSLIDKK